MTIGDRILKVKVSGYHVYIDDMAVTHLCEDLPVYKDAGFIFQIEKYCHHVSDERLAMVQKVFTDHGLQII